MLAGQVIDPDETIPVSPSCFSSSSIHLPFPSPIPQMLGLLSQRTRRQPAVSLSSAADSALFLVAAEWGEGEGGSPWLLASVALALSPGNAAWGRAM